MRNIALLLLLLLCAVVAVVKADLSILAPDLSEPRVVVPPIYFMQLPSGYEEVFEDDTYKVSTMQLGSYSVYLSLTFTW